MTESYPDQPYQQKIKIYATAKQLPDVFKFWSFTSLLKPLIDGGFVAPLNRADFEGFGYLPGALDSNTYGGKLYGIPVSADLWVIYYNKKLFKQAGIDRVPATVDELIALVPKFKARGIIPMTTDGKDAWPLAITFDQLAWRLSGDRTLPRQALDRKIKFTDPVFVQAARERRRTGTAHPVPRRLPVPEGLHRRRVRLRQRHLGAVRAHLGGAHPDRPARDAGAAG